MRSPRGSLGSVLLLTASALSACPADDHESSGLADVDSSAALEPSSTADSDAGSAAPSPLAQAPEQTVATTGPSCVDAGAVVLLTDASATLEIPDGLDAKERLGALLFNDKALSASGTESCASCHEQSAAFTGNNHRPSLFPVSEGAFSNLLGTRNTPTAMYAAFSPSFGFVEDADEPGAFTANGGQFWDGRASSLAEQARGPFLNPRELAMPDKQAVIERVRAAPYRDLFRHVFGERSLDDTDKAYDLLSEAIARFEQSDAFSPFTSRFDAFLRGEVQLDEREDLGFELFKDPEKGNCVSCHAGDVSSTNPADWLFTDFTYDNLGVPRNLQIPDNDKPDFFDLGLCQQPGLADRVPASVQDKAEFVHGLCGAFKVPTLRNVARTAPYMHNGYFDDLRKVVDFYATRSTEPARWYPTDADGGLRLYDDLPEQYHGNVNTDEAPYDRKCGEQPRLTPAEIDAVVAFLQTLSDGYRVEATQSAKP